MSQNTVTIKGKKDIVDSINDIETQPVKLSEISPGTSKDIYLQVPSGITIETKYITIKKNSEENAGISQPQSHCLVQRSHIL